MNTTSSFLTFTRYGNSYHAVIKTAADLKHTLLLDEALWVATAAPIETFRIDPVLLQQLDTHKDRRITADELQTAIRWLFSLLMNPEIIEEESDLLQVSTINPDAPDGPRIIDALQKTAAACGGDCEQVSLQQIRTLKTRIEQQPISGAGVILPEAGKDEAISRFLQTIVTCTGGAAHPGGSKGVDETTLQLFLSQARSYVQWLKQGASETPASPVKPLGDATDAAYSILQTLRDKINQYFTQCLAVERDPAFISAIWPCDTTTPPINTVDTDALRAMLRAAPLAKPDGAGLLSLSDPSINPQYKAALQSLQDLLLVPLQNQFPNSDTLSRADWEAICTLFVPYENWLKAKPDNLFDAMNPELLNEYLETGYANAAYELIRTSRNSSIELEQICLAEQLALYQKYLLRFANNFISLPDLYNVDAKALFEEGTLIMDGRRFNFAIRVFDRTQHAAIIQKGNMFVMYLEITSGNTTPYEIAVPAAAGTRGSLFVGKCGIFAHVDGSELNAKIVQIVEKPISLQEAMLIPFVKLGEIFTGKMDALSTSAGKQLEKAGSESISAINQTITATNTPAPAKNSLSSMNISGTLAGAGLAVAALSSSFALTLKMLAGIRWWQIILGLAAAILALLMPTLITAAIRLRKRDIKNLLEGSGWAINVPIRLIRPQRQYITSKVQRP